MKLLTIASSSIKGGATVSLLNTILGLRNRGIDIVVAVPEKGYLTNILESEKIKYYITPLPFWSRPNINDIKDFLKFPIRLLKLYYQEIKGYIRLKSLISEWQPDIIHTNVSVIDVGYRIAKKYNIPHIWHIREYGDLDFNIHSLYGKKNLRKQLANSYAICITHDLKKYFQLGSSARVIYNGIEEKGIMPIQKEQKIIYVGRLSEEKGVTEIVRTFCEFCKENNNYSLDLIGSYDPQYGNYLKDIVKNQELQDKVFFIGHVDDVYSRMQKAKAIIVASKCEGFGRITAEAMLNDCLVIGRDTGGTKEQFDNGLSLWNKEIGIRYGVKNTLLNALEQLTDLSENEYKEITERGKITVKTLYSVSQNVEKIYNYIVDILPPNKKNL